MISHDFDVRDYDSLFALCRGLQLAFLLVSPDLYLQHVNNVTEKIFNESERNLLNKLLPDLCANKGLETSLLTLSVDGRPTLSDVPSFHVLANGYIVDVHWSLSRYMNEENVCCGYLLIGKPYESMPRNKKKQNTIMQNLITSLPGAIYCKDTAGCYINSNAYLAKISGYSHQNQMLSKFDFDLPWANVSEQLRLADKEAIEGQSTIVIEEYPVLAGDVQSIMLSTKSPLQDESGNIIGMIGTSVDITHLKQTQFRQTTLGKAARLNKNEDGVYLTKKEIECISWMIKGKSSSEAAIILGVSARTIEVHINNIKRKLNCYKQFQLGYILGKYGSLLIHV